MKNFAITGVAGYVAPRHLEAIRNTGNRLVAALDPHDSVGILDSFFPRASFFTEFERFDRHLEKLRRGAPEDRVHILSICSPNYLHDAHVRLAMRVGADAICEKPLVLNPWNLDALETLEEEYGRKVHTVLQLRLHPALLELRDRLLERGGFRHIVELTYVTYRGTWYQYSWKGDPRKSGGVAMNIGIHFFDLLIWLFGDVVTSTVHLSERDRMSGFLELDNADVSWFLSVDDRDLPPDVSARQMTYRSIVVNDAEIEFSGGFRDLHTRVYEQALAGHGFSIADVRPSIELVHSLRHAVCSSSMNSAHPLLRPVNRSDPR